MSIALLAFFAKSAFEVVKSVSENLSHEEHHVVLIESKKVNKSSICAIVMSIVLD